MQLHNVTVSGREEINEVTPRKTRREQVKCAAGAILNVPPHFKLSI